MDDWPATEIDLRDERAAAPNCRTAAGLRFRRGLLEHLQAGGFPVLEARTAGGYDSANPAHLAEAGRALARYHALARTYRRRFRAVGRPALPTLERLGPDALARFTAVAGPVLASADRTRLSRASSCLWSRFLRVPEGLSAVVADLPQLVIHGSYEPGALAYRGDRLTGVAGFEHAAYDLRALDLAHALTAFAADGEGEGWGLDLHRAGRLVAAYRSVEPVSAVEAANLSLVLRARALAGVLAACTGYLSDPGAERSPEQAGGVVGTIEQAALATQWLEGRERALASVLGNPPVAEAVPGEH